MLGGFFSDWQNPNNTLQDCVDNAVAGVHTSSYQTLDSSWIIYGANDLRINSP
jgi:hypothetical protein